MRFRSPFILAFALGVAFAPLCQKACAEGETAPASNPVPAILSAEQLAPVAPIAAGPPAESSASVNAQAGSRVRIETVPAGIPFKIYASAYESPSAEVLRTGETPSTLADLPPGAYRLVLAPPGRATRAVSLQVPAGETVRIQQDFPYGTVKIRSQPKGAEVLCDGRKIGQTPLDWTVLPGRHKVTARWKGRTARVRTIQVADAGEKTVVFDFRTSSTRAKTGSGRAAEAEGESMLTKVKGILKKISSGIKKKGE